MPEVWEIVEMVIALLHLLLALEVNKVFTCAQYKRSSTMRWIDILPTIRLPFRIIDFYNIGHSLYLVTDRQQYFKFNLATGCYPEVIPFKRLAYYPYCEYTALVFTDATVNNEHDAKALVFTDCDQTVNQFSWELRNGKPPTKAEDGLGPCVATQYEAFVTNFLRKLRQFPSYFRKCTVAKMLTDPQLFNGFGQYTVSEMCARLYDQCNILPQSLASDIVCNTAQLQLLLSAVKTFHQERQLHTSLYSPGTFTRRQAFLRKKWQTDFLMWYGQRSYKGVPVLSYHFQGFERPFTIWTPTIVDIPAWTTTISSKHEQARIIHSFSNGYSEAWYRIKSPYLTPNMLSVGPHSWHTSKSRQLLQTRGILTNRQALPGPAQTPSEVNVNKVASKKRSSKRGKAKKQKLFHTSAYTQCNSIVAEAFVSP